MTRFLRVLFAVLIVAALAGPSAAGVQTGKHSFGKMVLTVHPVGGQVGFVTGGGGAAWKFAFDIAGNLKTFGNGIGLWLGGGFNWAPALGCLGCFHHLEPHIFLRVTLNLLNIPLVPYVEGGFAGAIFAQTNLNVSGGAGFRFGGGIDYWIIRQLALGVQTHFLLGGAGYVDGNDNVFTGFMGYWDVISGIRFNF
jgi:hypothetical protein